MITPGMIGLSNNKKGLFPVLIRFFTKSQFSHAFITLGKLGDLDTVLEASQIVDLVPFKTHYAESPTDTYRLYQVVSPHSYSELSEILGDCYLSYEGTRYGYLQTLWFVYRWLLSLLGKDATKQKNWFTDGVICSELVYDYLSRLGPEFQAQLAPYNSDTIQPQDLFQIMESNPKLFTLASEKL